MTAYEKNMREFCFCEKQSLNRNEKHIFPQIKTEMDWLLHNF